MNYLLWKICYPKEATNMSLSNVYTFIMEAGFPLELFYILQDR